MPRLPYLPTSDADTYDDSRRRKIPSPVQLHFAISIARCYYFAILAYNYRSRRKSNVATLHSILAISILQLLYIPLATLHKMSVSRSQAARFDAISRKCILQDAIELSSWYIRCIIAGQLRSRHLCSLYIRLVYSIAILGFHTLYTYL